MEIKKLKKKIRKGKKNHGKTNRQCFIEQIFTDHNKESEEKKDLIKSLT